MSKKNVQHHDNKALIRRVSALKDYKNPFFTSYSAPLSASSAHFWSQTLFFSFFVLFRIQLSSSNGSCFHIPFNTFPRRACRLWILPDHTWMIRNSSKKLRKEEGWGWTLKAYRGGRYQGLYSEVKLLSAKVNTTITCTVFFLFFTLDYNIFIHNFSKIKCTQHWIIDLFQNDDLL